MNFIYFLAIHYILEQYWISNLGGQQCPTGYEKIHVGETCKKASIHFKLMYNGPDNGNESSSACIWCGGCVPKYSDLMPVGGAKSKLLCQKEVGNELSLE